MQLTNTFTVPAPPSDVFDLLLDIEAIAPCMPGASLTGREGDRYEGELALRVGPLSVTYTGSLGIDDADPVAREATIVASGREARGQGSASARVRASVEAEGDDSSVVVVVTDLDIQGRFAQFGRGMLGDVAQNVIEQFATNLERTVLGVDDGAGPGSASTDGDGASLDAFALVVRPLLVRAIPLVLAFAVGFAIGRLISRGRWGLHARHDV